MKAGCLYDLCLLFIIICTDYTGKDKSYTFGLWLQFSHNIHQFTRLKEVKLFRDVCGRDITIYEPLGKLVNTACNVQISGANEGGYTVCFSCVISLCEDTCRMKPDLTN